jgi:N-acetylglucosamine-6-sulfatase
MSVDFQNVSAYIYKNIPMKAAFMKQFRRSLQKAALASSMLIFGINGLAEAAKRPNILFIFSDDHALRTISAYAGDKAINQTPNIDRIAKEGAIFTKSFCANSICQPSRAAILTGKHSHLNGVKTNGSKWNPKQQVFPRLLSKAGYQTAMIGKWHMHPTPSTEFDYHKTLTGHGGQGRYYNPEFITYDGKVVTEKGYSTDIIASESMEWMDQRDKDKPFMLMCQFKSPHTNVMPAIRHLELFKDSDIPVPDSYHNDNKGRSEYLSHTWMKMSGMKAPDVLKTGPAKGTYALPQGDHKQASNKKRKGKGKKKKQTLPGYYSYMDKQDLDAYHAHYDPINAEYGRRLARGDVSAKEKLEYPYKRYMKDYLRCVTAVDENVGRLLAYLEANGLSENTIVVYSSDQGFFLGENGWTDKRLMDEITMQMPFIIRWPNTIKPGQNIQKMIQNIDYAPTLLQAAGLDVPEDIQGQSFLPLLKGEKTDDWRDSLYYHYYHSGAYNLPKIEGVRGDRYKLVRYYDHPKLKLGEQWELFDLEKDPNEQQSFHNNPEYAGIIKEMKGKLESLREQYEAN